MAMLDALLAYQEADLEVDKLDAELRNTKAYKRYAKLKNYIAEQRRILTRMTQGLATHTNQVKIAKEHADLLQQRYEDGLQKYQAVDKDNLAEVERFRKYFEQLHARLAQERREFSEVANTLKKEDTQLGDMRVKLARASKEFEEMKAQVEQLMEEQKPQRDAAKAKSDELAKAVDADLLERYQVVKRGVATPVARVVDSRCTGCNMELSAVLLRRLKENADITECENCGRILAAEE